MVIEKLLQSFIGVIDAQLFETIFLIKWYHYIKNFKTCNIQDANE